MAVNKLKAKDQEQLDAALAKRAKAFRGSENQKGVRLIRPGNEDPFLSELAKQFNKTARRKIN